MTDAMQVAVVGVGGTVAVALWSSFMQWLTTRHVIRAEHLRTENQIAAEARARRDEVRHDKLVEALAELLATSDHESGELDYSRTVRLIHRLDLLLDARTSTAEGRLAAALHDLGFKLAVFMAVRHEVVGNRRGETQDLLRAHAAVRDAARPVLHPGEAPQLPPAA